MKLTVLVENSTYIDQYYLAEPALSFYLEADGKNFLFDTGYSDVYIQNAKKMGIDLSAIDMLLFSHGHHDHTGGLKYLPQTQKKIPLVAHPGIFVQREVNGVNVGNPVSLMDCMQKFELCLDRAPIQLTEHLFYLGEIPSVCDFEPRRAFGETPSGPDYMLDDTALAYRTKEGLFIITGCSHSGICNIVEQAKRVCGTDRIAGIIGGFHLFDVDERLEKTIAYLKEQQIKVLLPCHCVSFQAKAAIHQEIPIGEVATGLVLEVE